MALDGEYSDAEHYDKWLLTLSSSAFGLSIAFMRYIAPEPTCASLVFLVLSWLSLLAAIVATLVSLQVSQAGFRRYREILNARVEVQPQSDSQMNVDETNQPQRWVKFLNWLSLGCFAFGTLMLAFLPF